MATDREANVSRALDNYTRILVLVTEVIANPTQATIDAAVAAATDANQLNILVDYSLDGESYQWTAYQKFLVEQIKVLRELEQAFDGPWEHHVRGYT